MQGPGFLGRKLRTAVERPTSQVDHAPDHFPAHRDSQGLSVGGDGGSARETAGAVDGNRPSSPITQMRMHERDDVAVVRLARERGPQLRQPVVEGDIDNRAADRDDPSVERLVLGIALIVPVHMTRQDCNRYGSLLRRALLGFSRFRAAIVIPERRPSGAEPSRRCDYGRGLRTRARSHKNVRSRTPLGDFPRLFACDCPSELRQVPWHRNCDFSSSTKVARTSCERKEHRAMSATGLKVFDSTLQSTNIWLDDIMHELGWDDRHKAYTALRVVLHSLRDRLSVDNAAHLRAQLPMLVRGFYYDGWHPAHKPVKERTLDMFLMHITDAYLHDIEADSRQIARAVLGTISKHVTEGEVEKVQRALPAELRDFWIAESKIAALRAHS